MQQSSAPQPNQNIEAIIRLEQEDEERISHTHRISETIGSFAGRPSFVILQLIFVTAWASLNISEMTRFDPYPFPLLSVVLSLEAVLLTSFVLIRQNKMNARADRRGHLDLQINLLSEQETTRALQMLKRVVEHLGLANASDAKTEELLKDTAIEHLGRDLRANLKEESEPT